MFRAVDVTKVYRNGVRANDAISLHVAGTWDFIWSLPVPRSAAVASTCTVDTAMTIPGIVATLALAAWRYGLHLTVSPMAVPAFILASVMA